MNRSTSAGRYALLATLYLIVCCFSVLNVPGRATAEERPNFVVIFADDQGYQDLGCFGSVDIRTPNIDRLAAEGMRFTSFYAQTVCGPSRAALMTGCYPLRVATAKNVVEVHPRLHEKEITIAEVLKPSGYVSAAFGKWDLAGHSQTRYSKELLPRKQGFDYFFGTPTSNDSIIHLLRNEDVIEKNAEMSTATKRYTDEAIKFIKEQRTRPFFVYLAHTMPHIKLAASDRFRGKSERGIYGDVIEELDWNVGRLLEVLKECGVSDNTYVIYTSDNGPWFLGRSPNHRKRIGADVVEHGGSALPLRGAKTSVWEGGLRVPCVVWAPGKVPAGTECDEIATTMDILPTLADLAGADLPDDRVIDGHDISDLIHGVNDAKTPTEAFYYYQRTHLRAVRSGKWKLHLPRGVDEKWAVYSKSEDAVAVESPILFDLEADLSETKNVAGQHPEVVTELMDLVEAAREDIGDVDQVGQNARFFDSEPKRPDIAAAQNGQ